MVAAALIAVVALAFSSGRSAHHVHTCRGRMHTGTSLALARASAPAHSPGRSSVPIALHGEGNYDGEEDEYEEALARYEALGLFGKDAPSALGWQPGASDPEEEEDDMTPEMMLELSMRRLEALQQQSSGVREDAMQAAVAAAIDAAAALEAARREASQNASSPHDT